MLAVQDLEKMSDAKKMEVPNPPKKSGFHGSAEELGVTISGCHSDEDDEQRELEQLVKAHRDTKETSLLEQKIMDLYREIEVYKKDKNELEAQMEQLALDYEILKQENHSMSYKLEQSQLQDQLNMQYEYPPSFASINELQAQIECLESELNKQSKEFSHSLTTIGKLETHIKSLEEELEKQAQVYEMDLESIIEAKIDQEQRAIRAEEALRMTRWKNANTAESLQEELKSLSMQMAFTFNANEKAATKALTDASELCLLKNGLEELLKKAKEELQLVTEDYEAKLCDLSDQVNLKSNQIEQMLEEIDDKSEQLKHQKKHEDEVSGPFSQVIHNLKAETDRLTMEKKCLHEQAQLAEKLRLELEDAKAFAEEVEVLNQRGNLERNELVRTISLMKMEAAESLEEFQRMKLLKDEKEAAAESLQSELNTLKTQFTKLRESMFEEGVEKQKLRKQVVKLKDDLKKEDGITSMEKKLKQSNERATVSDGTKTLTENDKSPWVSCCPTEMASLREKVMSLEEQINLKEIALETSINVFLEMEKDLHKKIDELESRVEELNVHNTSVCKCQLVKAYKDFTDTSNDIISAPFVSSTGDSLSEKEPKTYGNQDKLIAELSSLGERNESMQNELKDMQERYSEISLKFEEVEGARQQLVMTVRTLKNAKKC